MHTYRTGSFGLHGADRATGMSGELSICKHTGPEEKANLELIDGFMENSGGEVTSGEICTVSGFFVVEWLLRVHSFGARFIHLKLVLAT